MRRMACRLCLVALSILVLATPVPAQPAFVNGLVIDGATLDATRQPGANAGRLGFFSDLYYDPVGKEWWALSDRGPGGGVLDSAVDLSGYVPPSGRRSSKKDDGDDDRDEP